MPLTQLELREVVAPGSITKGSPLTFIELDENFLFLSQSLSESIANIGAGSLLNTIVANQNVGGVTSGNTFTAGTSIESVLTSILVGYITPTLGSFTLRIGPSVVLSSNVFREVGNQLDFNTAAFTASTSSLGNYPTNVSITASGADTGDFTYEFGLGLISANNALTLGGGLRTIVKANPGVVTISMAGKNSDRSFSPILPSPASRTVSYVLPYIYGMSTSSYATTGNISSDPAMSIQLAGKGNQTLPIQGINKYIYFAYPAAHGPLSSIKDGNGFQLSISGDFDIYTRTQDSTLWSGKSYYIYRTKLLTTVDDGGRPQNYVFSF